MSEPRRPVDAPDPPRGGLERGLGTLQATALNIANMVGIGPFITIPLFVSAMQGPRALVGWVLGAALVACDGLVWSELGAAIPGSGGSYHFLREIYSKFRWGRLIPFLFIWQFLVTGALEMASGCVGAIPYLEYALPKLPEMIETSGVPGGMATVVALASLLVPLALCQRIAHLGWLAVALCAATLATVGSIIVAGFANFDASLLAAPQPSPGFDRGTLWIGLGLALRIAVYDYFGYYNVCHLGDEVRQPERTIPRAVLASVAIVSALYLLMNTAILGVLPWQRVVASKVVASEFMEELFGRAVAATFTWLILVTVAACMFALMLGYSRIPYAAARHGDFFAVFAKVHPIRRYPWVSLLTLGGLTCSFCYLSLDTLIEAAVVVRIGVQFIGQIVGLHLLRRRGQPMPFRMWCYPLPSLVALIGWLFLMVTASQAILLAALGVVVSGAVAFVCWNASRRST